MNLILKKKYHTSRGIIGMEAAIILIAFVIVAAALAFVVLNMGFATSQKAKTSIISALGETGSISISGKVIAGAPVAGGFINVTMVPLKLTSGGNSVDLDNTRATISYLGESVEYDNIYDTGCTLAGGAFTVYADPASAWTDAGVGCILGGSPFGGAPTETKAIIYWAVSNQNPNPNSILEPGEHAILSVAWSQTPDERPTDLDKIKIELAVSGGATLTVERTIPNISSTIVDLG